MAKKVGRQGSFLLQISITVIFVLLLGILAACSPAEQGTTDVTPPGEDEGIIIEPTDEMLAEPTDEMLAEPTDEGVFDDSTDGGAVTLSDVADNPEAYIGQSVTVTGEVSEIVDPQVFRMNEGNLLDIGDEILVVHTADQVTTDLSDDVNIRVTGTVRNFVQTEVEQVFDFDFSEDLYVEYENRFAIVADSVEPIATVSNINEDPEAYYGQNVSVIGDVVDLVGVNAFRLDDPALLSGDTVLVVGSEGLIVTEGDTVQVDGVVRQFNMTEVEGETGLDLEDEFFTDFDSRPAIVASSVMPAPAAE